MKQTPMSTFYLREYPHILRNAHTTKSSASFRGRETVATSPSPGVVSRAVQDLNFAMNV